MKRTMLMLAGVAVVLLVGGSPAVPQQKKTLAVVVND